VQAGHDVTDGQRDDGVPASMSYRWVAGSVCRTGVSRQEEAVQAAVGWSQAISGGNGVNLGRRLG
jgi:hypothetical protein